MTIIQKNYIKQISIEIKLREKITTLLIRLYLFFTFESFISFNTSEIKIQGKE